jgi:hypothetical protein
MDHVAVDVEVVKSNLVNIVNGDISGCANPPNLNETALIDTAASCTLIRSVKQDDNYGASNIVLPCPGS